MSAAIVFAFTAGLIAAVNPCGFAMLPAYVGFFLGGGDGSDDRQAGLTRAVVTAASMAAGFVVVLGAIGVLFVAGVGGIREALPWVVMVIGAAMVVLGVSMLFGFELSVALPRLERGGSERTFRSMAVFGMSYAAASLSCTLPLFLIAVVSRPDGFVAGVASVVAYVAGMSLMILALTVSMALAQTTVLAGMRRMMRSIDRLSGVVLIAAGAYTVWYWVDDVTRDGGRQPAAIRWVEERSFDIQNWVQDVGGLRLGFLLGAVVAAVVLVVLLTTADRPPPDEPDQEGGEPVLASSALDQPGSSVTSGPNHGGGSNAPAAASSSNSTSTRHSPSSRPR